MQHFQEIKLNGHILTAKDGLLYIDGQAVGLEGLMSDKILTKEEAYQKFHPSSKKFVEEVNTNQLLKKDDLKSIVEEIKAECLQKIQEPLRQLELTIKRFRREQDKNEHQDALSQDFPLYTQLEAIIEAFNGKPQKLEEIKRRSLEIKAELNERRN